MQGGDTSMKLGTRRGVHLATRLVNKFTDVYIVHGLPSVTSIGVLPRSLFTLSTRGQPPFHFIEIPILGRLKISYPINDMPSPSSFSNLHLFPHRRWSPSNDLSAHFFPKFSPLAVHRSYLFQSCTYLLSFFPAFRSLLILSSKLPDNTFSDIR